MRLSYVKTLAFLLLVLSADAEPGSKIDYHFNGNISRQVLENYLARSSTFGSLLHLTLDDDLRMIKNTGVKFAGRAVWMWGGESKIDDLVRRGEPFAKRIHAIDPDIILQGAIFEVISRDVDNVPVPATIFEEFGVPQEPRNFSYKAMLYPFGHRHNHWSKGSSVP
ncbi:MAG: hypothetical protein VX269_06670, partial [Verrucomicrobiota bacterium]|nr:hypothetical protein [Verrucomicrobiota bacterium]